MPLEIPAPLEPSDGVPAEKESPISEPKKVEEKPIENIEESADAQTKEEEKPAFEFQKPSAPEREKYDEKRDRSVLSSLREKLNSLDDIIQKAKEEEKGKETPPAAKAPETKVEFPKPSPKEKEKTKEIKEKVLEKESSVIPAVQETAQETPVHQKEEIPAPAAIVEEEKPQVQETQVLTEEIKPGEKLRKRQNRMSL